MRLSDMFRRLYRLWDSSVPIVAVKMFMGRYRTDDIRKRRARFVFIWKAELLEHLEVRGLSSLSTCLSLSCAVASPSGTPALREIDNILNPAPCDKLTVENVVAG